MVGYSRTKSLTLLGGVLAALLGAPLVPILTAENNLAHTDGFRSDFHALVLVGEVQGLFEAHLDRRSQGFEHICGGGTHVGHMLGQRDVHIQLVRLVVHADDLAFVHRRLRFDEEVATCLQTLHGVRSGDTLAIADHGTVLAGHDW